MITDKMIAFFCALSVHGTLLLGGQAIFVQPAEFGVDTGLGGVEVNLVAAPRMEEETPSVEKIESAPVQKAEEMALPEAEPEKKIQNDPREVHGDGSSPVPGRDATTFSSAGGAITEYKPGYLKNPAPRYPAQARAEGQEGLVVLWAYVSASGEALSIDLKKSSGFPLLDEAALKAVKRWKFQPARMGGLAMDSRVEIPIRFQLTK